MQTLKFKTDEQNFLNDILLRVSAFGLFVYAVFSVIAGALNAFTREPNLLVMVTGAIAILQVSISMEIFQGWQTSYGFSVNRKLNFYEFSLQFTF